MAAHLSIGIPSNRPLALSRSAIASAYDFCKRNGYSLVVSDNSGEEAKRAWLTELMANDETMNHIDSPPCGMMENWFQTFHATRGEYVLMMGDDDTIFAYETAPPFTDLGSDIVGIRPAVAGYAEGRGILRMNTTGISEDHGAKRVAEHMKTSSGMNLGLFTFWERKLFEDIMNLWFGPHPTKGHYCDWAVMNALCSSGKIVRHPAGCYFYNLQNWMGDAAAIQAQVERAYVKSGLPAGSAAYERVFNAIDSFIFINRASSPLPYEERFVSAAFTLDFYLKHYCDKPPQNSSHANAVAIAEVSRKLVGLDDIPTILNVVLEVLEAIEPGLAQRYRDFNQAATGRAWASF